MQGEGPAPAPLSARYQPGRRLSEGPACRVHEARDLLLERDVVVKVLHGLPDDAGRSRAVRAARAAARVTHPHVVRVLDVHQGEPSFLVLEPLDARPLDVRRLAGLAPGTLLDLGDELLAGLSALHEAGAVHGDVRAEHVLVTTDGRIVLTSTGIAATASGQVSAAADAAAAATLLRDVLGPQPPEVGALLARASGSAGAATYPDATALRAAYRAAAGLPPHPAAEFRGRPAASAAPPDAAPPDPAPPDAAPPLRAAATAPPFAGESRGGPVTGASARPAAGRRWWVAGVAVAAVAVLGLGLFSQRARLTGARTPSAAAQGQPSPSAGTTVPPSPAPAPTPDSALDALLARADLPLETAGDRELVASLEELRELAGAERAPRAAELLGLVVEGTRDGGLSRAFARDAFDALAAEVTLEGLVAFGEGGDAGPDGAAFLERLRGFGALQGMRRGGEAAALFGLASRADSGLAGPFRAAASAALLPEVTLDGLVALAEAGDAGEAGAAFAERLRGLDALRGPARGREAAALFASASRADSGLAAPFRAAVSAALLREVTLDGLVALAQGADAGPGGPVLLKRLRGLDALEGAPRAAEARALLGEVDASGDELSPAFRAAAVQVLRPIAAGGEAARSGTA